MIQIDIENGTTFRRRIFLHALQMTVTEPIPLALSAWKYFDLVGGANIGSVDGDFQIGVCVSRIVHGVGHGTAFTEAKFGDAFGVQLADGAPVLSRGQTSSDSIDVTNGVSGPQASAVDVTLYRDYAPFLVRAVPSNDKVTFVRLAEFYCYSSMPFNSGEEALALEPVVGYVNLRGVTNVRLHVLPDGSRIQWKVNGQPAGV